MTRKNPLTKGRMYKVSNGGRIKGIRFNKNGTTDVLIVPGAGKKRNPPKKKRKPNTKKKGVRLRYSPSIKRYYKDYGVSKQYMPKGWKPAKANRKRAAKKKK